MHVYYINNIASNNINTYTSVNFNPGDPCTNISSALNGQIQCTGPQVTAQNCTFTCDPGYNLTGSVHRTCQSDHTWSGETTLCLPLHCIELTVPDNASFTSPCNTEYTSSCTVVCVDGFHVEGDLGTTEWTQTCVLTKGGDVEWTEGKKCFGKNHKYL